MDCLHLLLLFLENLILQQHQYLGTIISDVLDWKTALLDHSIPGARPLNQGNLYPGSYKESLGSSLSSPRLDFLKTKGQKGTLKIGGYHKLVPKLSRTTCRLFEEVLFLRTRVRYSCIADYSGIRVQGRLGEYLGRWMTPGRKVPMCRQLVTTPELDLLLAGGEVDFSQTEAGPLRSGS